MTDRKFYIVCAYHSELKLTTERFVDEAQCMKYIDSLKDHPAVNRIQRLQRVAEQGESPNPLLPRPERWSLDSWVREGDGYWHMFKDGKVSG